MRAHIIENGIVKNTIVVAELGEGMIEATAGGPGWLWDGQTLSPPPVEPDPVPSFVSMRQARLALLGAGLLDTVNAGIGQMGQAEQIEWEYASEVRRDSALVAAMGAALNLDDAALDALFVTAATL
jgi:hypothetical protein